MWPWLSISLFLVSTSVPDSQSCQDDLPHLVSRSAIQARFQKRQTPGKPYFMGLMRNPQNALMPIFSDTSFFESYRNLPRDRWGENGWESTRTAKLVPLKKLAVKKFELKKSPDFQFLPKALRNLLESGTILVTAKASEVSGYDLENPEFQAWMAESPSPLGAGRTGGPILHRGLPWILDIGGKEFMIELSGLGIPSGGFDDIIPNGLRGGIHGGCRADEALCQFENIENERNYASQPWEGIGLRTAGVITFDGPHGKQGYVIRLAPGNIRSTYKTNFSKPKPQNYQKKISYRAGEIWAGLLSRGILPASHFENLVLTHNFRDVQIVDYPDLVPIGRFPTVRTNQMRSPVEALESAISLGLQMDESGEFLLGLTDRLVKLQKISAEDAERIHQPFSSWSDRANILWRAFLADLYVKQRMRAGLPEDLTISIQSGIKAVSSFEADLPVNIQNHRRHWENTRQQKSLEFDNLTARMTGVDYASEESYLAPTKKIIAIFDKVENFETARSLIEEVQAKNTDRIELLKFSPELEGLFQALDSYFNLLNHGRRFLNQEIELLEYLEKKSTRAEEKTMFQENLRIAKEKLSHLKLLSPINIYEACRNGERAIEQLFILPYQQKDPEPVLK